MSQSNVASLLATQLCFLSKTRPDCCQTYIRAISVVGCRSTFRDVSWTPIMDLFKALGKSNICPKFSVAMLPCHVAICVYKRTPCSRKGMTVSDLYQTPDSCVVACQVLFCWQLFVVSASSVEETMWINMDQQYPSNRHESANFMSSVRLKAPSIIVDERKTLCWFNLHMQFCGHYTDFLAYK